MDTGTLAFDLRRSYQLFFSWLNEERGGICVGGQRRPAQLTLVGDGKHKESVRWLTTYLIRNESTRLLFAPYGSSLTEYAAGVADKLGATLVAPASSSTGVFRDRPTVFGTLPPASLNLGGVFEVLQAHPGVMVSSIVDNDSFARAACGVIPELARQYGLQVGPSRTLSSAPTSSEILTAVRDVTDPQNGVMIGCVRKAGVCNSIVRSMASLGLNPKAMAFTVCVMTAEYNISGGRFAMGTTAWIPELQLRAAWPSVDYTIEPSWNSSGWAKMYRKEYAPPGSTSTVVSYQAASTWAACVTLVTAVEIAGSTNFLKVANSLRKISLNTIFGRIAFDANGQNTGLWNVVQYQGQDDKVRFVAPLDVRSESAIFPLPPQSEKECWVATPVTGYKGFYADRCVVCPRSANPSIAVFNATAKRRECRSCPTSLAPAITGRLATCSPSCPRGKGHDVGGTTCRTCPPGTESQGGRCVDCVEGTFASSAGSSTCELCKPGRFGNSSKATTCYDCAVGEAANNDRSTNCRSCSRGTFADVPGSSICGLCAGGTVATGLRSSSCDVCGPGTYSAWGAQSCDLCESGKYQNQQQMSTCIQGGGLGATFEGTGLTIGINKRRYWTLLKGTNLTWQLCLRGPEACLSDNLCAEGSTGMHCHACVPGYAHRRSRGRHACFKCPPLVLNIAMTVLMVLLSVAFIFWLVQTINQSIRRPQDMRVMLVKAFIFYIIMADAAFAMMADVTLDYLYNEVENVGDSWDMMARTISWVISPFRVLPGFCILSETSVWSINCLFQSSEPELAATVKSFTHIDYHNTTCAPHWDKLSRFHHDTELRVAIFWAVWPLLLAAVGYVIGLILVVRRVRQRQDFYNQALSFYEDLLDVGTKRSTQARTQDAWIAYVKAYSSKVAGLWWPIPHAQTIRDGQARFVNWRIFNREAKSMMQCTVLVCQGTALVGTMRAFNCASFAEGDGEHLSFANSLKCMDMSQPLVVFSLAAHISWGLGMPLLTWLSLKRATTMSHWNSGLEDHSVLLRGYGFHAWYWEVVVMVMKYYILVIAHLPFEVNVKTVLLLLLAMFYGFLSTLCLPYRDHTHLAGRINGLFVLLWIFQAISTQLIFLLAQQSPAAWVMLVCVLFIACVHLAFLFKILYSFHRRTLESFMMGVDVKAWTQSLDEPKSRNIVTFTRRRLLNQYMRYLCSWPYVCLDNDFNWVTVCGSGANHAVVPLIPRGQKTGLRNGKPDLSAAPAVPEHPATKAGKEHHQQELQRCLQSAVEAVIEIVGMPTFSASVLEFVMRAGMLLAIGYETQRRQLSALHRKLTPTVAHSKLQRHLEEITVTKTSADPMDLLGDSADTDEGHRASAIPATGNAVAPAEPRTSLWQVAKVRLHQKAEAESEEVADYKRQCEAVRKLELVRTYGEVRQSSASVTIRKRASAAMTRTMFLFQVVSSMNYCWWGLQNLCCRRRKHLDEDASGSGSSASLRTISREIRSARESETPLDPEVAEKYNQMLVTMFAPHVFAKGVELSSLQLGLQDLMAVPPQEMRHWLDKFEEFYVDNKDIQSHAMKRLGNLVKDACVQTAPEEKEHPLHEEQRAAGSSDDPYTVSWLPKLGILPGPSRKGRKVEKAKLPTDASTQTMEGDLDDTALLSVFSSQKNKVFQTMHNHGKRAVVAWARLVVLSSLPDIKVMGPVLRERQNRCVQDLTQQLDIARAKHDVVQRERVALERRNSKEEAIEGVADSTPAASGRAPVEKTNAPGAPKARPKALAAPKVLPPAQKGIYED